MLTIIACQFAVFADILHTAPVLKFHYGRIERV